MNQTITINRPLANTYGWLHVNGTAVDLPAPGEALRWDWKAPLSLLEGAPALNGLRTGMGPDMGRMVAAAAPLGFTLPEGEEAVLRLRAAPGTRSAATDGAAGVLRLDAAAGSTLTAVVDLPAQGLHTAALQIRARAGEGAVLRLAIVQRMGEDSTLLSDVGVQCGENARFELVRLVLGGGTTYDGCSVALAGDGSSFSADLGYRLSGQNRLDMNYEAIHTGKRTSCAIQAAGVLRERASKLFRGTIDLRKGCSGSVGNETEDVLLLDETVRNTTLPVILCSEEDVEGNHGATIGRLDEGLIYYLQSRGMEQKDVYDLCARAKIDAVIRRIPDRQALRDLFPELEEVDP